MLANARKDHKSPLELHSEIGAIDVNQRFLVSESNFC